MSGSRSSDRGERVGDRGDAPPGRPGRRPAPPRARDRQQLGGVGLGRGDRPFRAGRERDRPVGGRGQRRGGLVGDRDGRRALGAGRRDDGDDVRRGARLADPDDERVGEVGRGAVERHDRRRPEPDRQPVPDAEDVLRVDRRVVGRAAGGDDDVPRRAVAERGGERLDRRRPGRRGTVPRPRAARGSRRGGSSRVIAWRGRRPAPVGGADRPVAVDADDEAGVVRAWPCMRADVLEIRARHAATRSPSKGVQPSLSSDLAKPARRC